MKLTEEEINNPLWQKLKKHLSQRLDHVRIQNDAMLEEHSTCALRGRIEELKYLLGLDKTAPAVFNREQNGSPQGDY